MGDFGLVREALRERELLLTRLAPHLVQPVPFLWPLRGRGWERAYLGAGLVLYDTIGGARSVPRHRHLTRRGALRMAPALRAGRARRRACSSTTRQEDDARHGRVRRADRARRTAHQLATRVRVTGLLARPGVVRSRVDEETGEPLTCCARATCVDAAGRLDRRLRELAGGALGAAHRAVQGHPHLRRRATGSPMEHRRARAHREERAVHHPVAGRLADRRHRHALAPARTGPSATGADIDYLLAKANALLAEPLARDDVHGVTAGLRPLVAPAARADTTRISRQHAVESPAARAHHDRRRQVHDLPRDGGRPRRRGRAARVVPPSTDLHTAPGGGRLSPLTSARGSPTAAGLDAPRSTPARPLRRPVDDLWPDRRAPRARRAARRRGAPARRGRLRLHARGRAPPRRRARAAHAARARRRADRGLGRGRPPPALMAGVLGWSRERTRAEVDGWRARVGPPRSGRGRAAPTKPRCARPRPSAAPA